MPHNHHDHDHQCCGDQHEHEHLDEKGIMYSLYQKINTDLLTCLNESVEGSGKTVFKPWEERLSREKFVESDVDAELLFNIPFLGNVKIKSIIIIGGENGSHPKSLRLFTNRPQMSFDNVSIKADGEFELTQDEQGAVEYPLPQTKFSNVNHLSIHIPNNYGDENTKMYYIGLAGEFLGVSREGVVVATYESRPMIKDHKGEIPDGSYFQVS